MTQIGKIIWDSIDSYWMGVFAILIFGGFISFITCPYLWHNAILYILIPFIMLIISNIISRNFSKNTSIISMTIINVVVILSSCILFTEMRESWDEWDEPIALEYFVSNKLYYCISMFVLMILSMKFASQFAVVCPNCGEWNTAVVLKRVVEGSYKTTMQVRNDKKVYDNTGEHIASIENYDTFDHDRSYGYYLCKCTNCQKKWKEDF